MNVSRLDLVIPVLISLIPFVLVGIWLFYRDAKSKDSLFWKKKSSNKKIKVGDNFYVVGEKSRIVAREKKSGQEVIVTTCGFEDEQQQLEGELTELPEGIKVCYCLPNGVFSPEESDWLAGENFQFLRISTVKEYVQVS